MKRTSVVWVSERSLVGPACTRTQVLNCVQLFATPWTAAHQAPLSMALFRQEYWSGLPFPPLRDLSNPGVESTFLASYTLAGVS